MCPWYPHRGMGRTYGINTITTDRHGNLTLSKTENYGPVCCRPEHVKDPTAAETEALFWYIYMHIIITTPLGRAEYYKAGGGVQNTIFLKSFQCVCVCACVCVRVCVCECVRVCVCVCVCV